MIFVLTVLMDQLGHMRTNKHCPKYREDPETHLETPDLDKTLGKSLSLNSTGQSQLKTLSKKLIPRSATKIALVEASDGENPSPNTKVLPVKFKCGSTEKNLDKSAPGLSQKSDHPVTSDPDPGKSAVKVNKIIISNKMKPEDAQVETPKPSIVIKPPTVMDKGLVESQKPTIVIRPPANAFRDQVETHKTSTTNRIPIETEREQSHKKIKIKRSKEIIDVDQVSRDGVVDHEHRKTKRIAELTSFEKSWKHENKYTVKGTFKKGRDDRRWLEEQERRRNEAMLREEMVRRQEEEMRMLEEQERLAEIRRYEDVLRKERREEERLKAKKKRSEVRDEYTEDPRAKRFDKRMLERDRSAKRSVLELGKYSAEYASTTKRRRGGEVSFSCFPTNATVYNIVFIVMCCSLTIFCYIYSS